MKRAWIFGISAVVGFIIIMILVATESFDVWAFSGMIFYGLIFAGGYAFIIYGQKEEQKRLAEENRRKQKFDWCWDRANDILRRMAGGQGLSWAKGFGRSSEYQSFYDGVQSRPFRSMLGYLSNSKQLALVIYDIDRDDIVRFVTNPDPTLLDNHFRYFRPFAKGGGTSMYNEIDYPSGIRGSMFSRRFRQDPYANMPPQQQQQRGGMDIDSMKEPKPDDDMIDAAVGKVKENQ